MAPSGACTFLYWGHGGDAEVPGIRRFWLGLIVRFFYTPSYCAICYDRSVCGCRRCPERREETDGLGHYFLFLKDASERSYLPSAGLATTLYNERALVVSSLFFSFIYYVFTLLLLLPQLLEKKGLEITPIGTIDAICRSGLNALYVILVDEKRNVEMDLEEKN